MARKKAPEGALAKRSLQKTHVAAWREHRGLNQDVLASRVEEILGVSFTASTLSRIENGRGPYSQPQLEALAEALNCLPLDLISRPPDAPPLISIQGLPEGDADRVYEFIRALRITRERDDGRLELELERSPKIPKAAAPAKRSRKAG